MDTEQRASFPPQPPKPEGLVAAEKLGEERAERLRQEGLQVLDEMSQQVLTMTLAQRFNRKATAEELDSRKLTGGPLRPTFYLNQAIEAEGEAGYKREQLKIAIEKLRGELLQIASDIKVLTIDIEASQRD